MTKRLFKYLESLSKGQGFVLVAVEDLAEVLEDAESGASEFGWDRDPECATCKGELNYDTRLCECLR